MRKVYFNIAEEGQGGGDATPSWYYSQPNTDEGFEGVAGNGDVPDWFIVDKFKSVDEQAKSYGELEKRFGGFAGAPDEYTLPEGLEADSLDGGMLDIVKEIGKEHQMGQNMFNELVGKVAEYQQQQMEQVRTQSMEQLGEKAEERIANVNNWINTNLTPEQVQKVQNIATSAEAIEIMEEMISRTKASNPASEAQPQTKMTQAEYAEKLMAKNSYGDLRINSDPEYKKQMDELAKQFI